MQLKFLTKVAKGGIAVLFMHWLASLFSVGLEPLICSRASLVLT